VGRSESNSAGRRTCTNCGHSNPKEVRWCNHCGWLMEPEPPAQTPSGPLESTITLLSEAFPRDEVVEAIRFVDRQLVSGSQMARKGMSNLRAQLSTRADRLAGQGQKQEEAPPPPEPVQAQAPCPRCGAKNRAQSRFCSRCGASTEAALPRSNLVLTFDKATDRGQKRQNNEDRVETWSAVVQGVPTWLFVVADGMGGEQAGEVASGMLVDAVHEQWQRVLAGQALAGQELPLLAEAIREANRRIHAEAAAKPALRGMGTTATLILIRQNMAYVAHVGDSRAYLVDGRNQVQQVTEDHSLVAVLVAIGQITAEEALTHDNRSMLYRSVGPEAKVEPDTYTRRLEPGDRMILCTDGLAMYARDSDLIAAVAQGQTPAQACRALIALANARGGEDNISVIVLAVQEPKLLPPTA